MSDSGFASLPKPPYYAVIFSSRRNAQDAPGYAHASQRMLELAARQPGFLGAESARDPEGFGITVSYWTDEAAISGWKAQAEHAAVRERGRRDWYAQFEVRVARVERAYGQIRNDGNG
jgi:heme-degrading monooxygenase HmoA